MQTRGKERRTQVTENPPAEGSPLAFGIHLKFRMSSHTEAPHFQGVLFPGSLKLAPEASTTGNERSPGRPKTNSISPGRSEVGFSTPLLEPDHPLLL